VTPMTQRERFLLAEARHRTANAFQVVASLVQRELNGATEIKTILTLRKIEAQLRAFALLNDMLCAADADDEANLCAAAYVKRLCDHLRAACLTNQGVSLNVAAPEPQMLPEMVCRYLGLIVAELVLNAAKHAFRDRFDGEVAVRLGGDDGDAPIRLVVADNGCGVDTLRTQARRGLGFVQVMAEAIGAECAGVSTPGGTTVVVTLPYELRRGAA
jgi:two-component sensor histidine kinase